MKGFLGGVMTAVAAGLIGAYRFISLLLKHMDALTPGAAKVWAAVPSQKTTDLLKSR